MGKIIRLIRQGRKAQCWSLAGWVPPPRQGTGLHNHRALGSLLHPTQGTPWRSLLPSQYRWRSGSSSVVPWCHGCHRVHPSGTLVWPNSSPHCSPPCHLPGFCMQCTPPFSEVAVTFWESILYAYKDS